MNRQAIERGNKLANAYAALPGMDDDPETQMIDAIADMLAYAAYSGHDWQRIADMARMHAAEETQPETEGNRP